MVKKIERILPFMENHRDKGTIDYADKNGRKHRKNRKSAQGSFKAFLELYKKTYNR